MKSDRTAKQGSPLSIGSRRYLSQLVLNALVLSTLAAACGSENGETSGIVPTPIEDASGESDVGGDSTDVPVPPDDAVEADVPDVADEPDAIEEPDTE